MPIWLKLAQWFWGRRFLNFDKVFSIILNYLPLENQGGCFVPSLVEIDPVVFEKKLKIGKVYRQTDRQLTGDQRSSLELSAQVS